MQRFARKLTTTCRFSLSKLGVADFGRIVAWAQEGPVLFIKAEGGRLYASDDGKSWDEVYAESQSVFFAKGRDLAITFKKDSMGMVTHMEIITSGTTIRARRIE